MTVQSTDRKAGPFFSGTILPFDFKVFSKEDIQVIWTSAAGVESILVLDSEYSVALNPDQDNTPGGSVTLNTAISDGANAVIIGDLEYDQGTDIRNQSGFEPEIVEGALDRLTILVQQLLETTKRTLRIPASSSSNISTQLPQPTAGNVLGWNGEANQLTNLSPQDIATTVAFGTAFVDQFEGDSVQTEFSLSANPALLANMDVQVDGASLRNGIDFVLLAGAVIKFTTAPAAPAVPGELNIQVRGTVAVPQGFDTADVVVTQLPESGLWTTVQGFINRIISGIGASIVGYTATGSNAVESSIEEQLHKYCHASNFGKSGGNTIANLVGIAPAIDGVFYDAVSYHNGFAVTTRGPEGGGLFIWSASTLKSRHNGGTIISPTVPWDGTQGGLADFLDAVGETDPSGSGCWLRVDASKGYAKWFGARGNNVDIDTASVQATINWVKVIANGTSASVILGEGDFPLDGTLIFDTIGIGFIGTEQEGRRQQGSDLAPSAIIWRGGAAPMFRTSVSLMTFKNFGLRNEGSATDWLEMLAGSQHFIFDGLSIIGGSGGGGIHTAFSRSTIYSNGARLGYSTFKRCLIKTPSTDFILMENSGTVGVTPFVFEERCIIDAVSGPMTILKVVNCALDSVIFRGCTFNQQGPELTIFDNSTGTAQPCLAFSFEDNEIDSQASSAAYRFFRFRNTSNIRFNGNVVNGGGLAEYCADLVNSHIVQCEGNEYKSFATNLFNPDATSFINVGRNFRNSGVGAEFSLASAGIFKQPYVATMQLNLNQFPAYRDGVFEIDVTDAAAYTIRVDTSIPQSVTPGQKFTVAIRNMTGGAINAGAFTTNMNTTGALTAPAAGFQRNYQFYWNGTRAIEIGRSAGDVAYS